MADVSPELLAILRCPHCVTAPADARDGEKARAGLATHVGAAAQPVMEKGRLRRDGDRLECMQCGRRYKIEDGIPDMIIEHAELPDRQGRQA
jgi:uncharacterized protein YbaR (Trm112 family)